MFSPSPLDKNCINSDSCSSSRNSAPNRFSVGITPLGDENQQIRIQLAVHKYNGTAGSPFNNRCSFMSPVRHSFLKNSLKVRNYEGDHEGTSKTDKKIGNAYEGVGSFPTVHLKKNAVRYRPIKRFHDVKIPYPEIPVNRFLSHIPEVCSDLRSNTRSVLDVLEDLSGNKIHSKEDNGSGKPKSRGLGGDYLLNPSAVFKPLFVQKPKINAVLTRDNTTQTLSPVSIETPSPQSSTSSYISNGSSDPRAELRRKLAKQNNEIFASLSSSISPAFCLKRKIDRVLPSKDDGQSNEGSALKKTKTADHHSCKFSPNGIDKTATNASANSRESLKMNRKTKLSDVNSVSPNKDRLTTIFLDTRNTSPKARVFQANRSQVTKSGSLETNGELAGTTSSAFAVNAADGKGKDESKQSSLSFSTSPKPASSGSDKQDMEQSDNVVVNSSNIEKSTSPIQDAANSNFSIPKTVIENDSNSNGTCQTTGKENDSERKENNDTNRGFVFGNSDEKASFGAFKFGVVGSTPSVQNKALTEPKASTAEPVSTAHTIATTSTAQFTVVATSNAATSPLQTSAFQFGLTTSQNTFSFGHNTFLSQPKSPDTSEKHETSESMPASTTTTTRISQPVTFTFAQTSNVSCAPTNADEDVLPTTSQTSPTKAVSLLGSFNKNSQSSSETGGALFALDQKSETPVTSASQAPFAQQQVKAFPFAFGQKSDVGQSEGEVESTQKNVNLFSGEQKPVSQQSAQSSTLSTDATASGQSSMTQANHTLAQAVSQPATTSNVTFSQCSTAFGTKLDGISTNCVFSNKTLALASSMNAFGKTPAQTATGFATSTSTAPAFGFQVPNTTRSIPTFGVSPTTQASSTASPFSTSVAHSTPGFSASSTTQTPPTFGVFSATQSAPTFGSSTKQSVPSFGTTSTTHSTSTFPGVSSQSAPSFATSPSTQTTFTAPTAFGLGSSQSPTVFGAPTSTQSTIRFGPTTTQSSATFGSSTGFSTSPSTQSTTVFGPPSSTSTSAFAPSQSLDNKPASSLSQTPSIFSQNPTSVFSSSQNNIFASKPAAETTIFGQNKLQSSGFGSTPQVFGSQSKFPFGMSTSSATGFTTSPATTTAPVVFSFGGTTTGNAFTVGSSSSGSSNTTTPFAFRTPANEPFKFGATATTGATTTTTTSTTKEATGFGGAGSSAFSGANQLSNAPTAEQKPANAAAPGFNFRTTPSPSLFSFGGSTSSGSSGSSFNFGSPPSGMAFGAGTFNMRSSGSSGSNFNFGAPTGGVTFGQGTTPGSPFAVPGTFNIGSGSSQSRPRASSRSRRRP